MRSHLIPDLATWLPLLTLSPALMAATIDDGHIQHVLLISVDGMHAHDAAAFIAANPGSTLAALSSTAITYTNASCTRPSDSFPGLCALVTGGLPQDTGLWYDDAWDRSLYQPADTFPTLGGGATHGAPPTPLAPGIECVLTELLDQDGTRIDAGASQLPAGSIPINPNYLPRNAGMKPVWPHQIIRVNTVFEVAKAAGKRTAWSDKHAAYEWVNGPSGLGVDDFYVLEINSNLEVNGTPLPFGGPTNGVEACTDYDGRKVKAIINEINGKDSSGAVTVGTPAIFGMNFQCVSVGQKVSKDGQAQSGGFDPVANPDGINGIPAGKGVAGVVGTKGGYADASGTPTLVLAYALSFVDQSLGQMVAALKTAGLYQSTLIIITAKHGQSPIDPSTLRMKHAVSINTNLPIHDPTDSLTGGGTANGAALPAGFVQPVPNTPPASIPAGFTQTDTIGLVWYQDNHSTAGMAAVTAAVNLLQTEATETTALGYNPDAIDGIIAGPSLTALFDDPTQDPRTPDIIITPIPGTIYSGSSAKYMEHGGFGPDDTQVAMIISNPSLAAKTITSPVNTTSVAPTILKSLGLDPNALQAVQKEATPVLTGLGLDGSAPPVGISDLSAATVTNTASGEVTLSWTAPSDPGSSTGAPASYDIRWSNAPLNDDSWNSAAALGGAPAPMAAGSSQTMTSNGLPKGQKAYFAIKSMDSAGNASVMSNVAATTTTRSGSSGGCGSGSGLGLLGLLGVGFMYLRLRSRE